MRGLVTSLVFFGVQVCCEDKIKWMIEIVMGLTSPSLGVAEKTGFL